MKKKIRTVLSLVLVLAAVVVVCTACSGKEEAKEETAKMNLTFVNVRKVFFASRYPNWQSPIIHTSRRDSE